LGGEEKTGSELAELYEKSLQKGGVDLKREKNNSVLVPLHCGGTQISDKKPSAVGCEGKAPLNANTG